MKHFRSWQGRVRTLLSRAEHSGSHAERSQSTGPSSSGRVSEEATSQPTPVFRGHSARYGPQPPFRLPWREGVLFLSGGAIGWVASRTSSASFDLSGLELGDVRDYFRGTQSWQFGFAAEPALSPNFLADAAAKAVPAVVSITINAANTSLAAADRTCGSGFITDPSGVIMTSAHVVEDALARQRSAGIKPGVAPLSIGLQDGRSFEGSILSIDRVSDLALIKIEADEALPTVKMGSSGGMRVGEWVLALGSPLTLQNSVTAGIVSCVGRRAKELGLPGSSANYIQTDAAVNSGNSGGPLVNMGGEVVGVSCLRALHSNGVSFAIPIDEAREIMQQLRGQGRVVRPYIGIKMLQLNPQNAAQIQSRDSGFPPLSRGILVPSVHAGSPACKAGLKQGDIITGVGGLSKGTLTTASLIRALTHSIGRPLQLEVRRGKQELVLSIIACEAREGI